MAARSTVTAFMTWASEVPPNPAGTEYPRVEVPAPVTRRSWACRAAKKLCRKDNEGTAGRCVRMAAKRTAAATSEAEPTGRVVYASALPPGTSAPAANPPAGESCPIVPGGTRETTR